MSSALRHDRPPRWRATLLGVWLLGSLFALSAPSVARSNLLWTTPIELAYSQPAIEARHQGYVRYSLGDLPLLSEPGKPALPFQQIWLLLPPTGELVDVHVDSLDKRWLEAPARPEPAQAQFPISSAGLSAVVADATVYEGMAIWPPQTYDIVREQAYHGFRLLCLRLYPLRFDPRSQRVLYTARFRVSAAVRSTAVSNLGRSLRMTETNAQVAALVSNVQDLAAFAPRDWQLNPGQSGLGTSEGLINPTEPCDYIIVTGRAFLAAFEPLAEHRRQQELAVGVYTIEDILPLYDGQRPDGGNDDPTRLRQFLREAHDVWQASDHPLRYVLLAGDAEIIPAREVYVRAGIYETSDVNPLLCDGYYAGLDGTWDADRDGLYGEGAVSGGGTGTAGEEADLLAELVVGRVPVSEQSGDPPDLQARQWVAKQLAYESDPEAEYLNRALWLGEKLDATTYGGPSKETVLPLVPELEIRRLYDEDQSWSAPKLVEQLNGDVHIINHLGYGSSSYVLRLSRDQVEQLSNVSPFLVHSQACLAAAFSKSPGEAIAEIFLTDPHGAFAFVGNTSYGWYMPERTDGASQLYDQEFFDALYREAIAHLGAALQDAKEDMLPMVGAVGPERWVYLELTLLGDPYTIIPTDYGAPIAQIISPKHGSTSASSCSITGTAALGKAGALGFDGYDLEVGAGLSPTQWDTVASASSPKESDALGTWDAAALPDGLYTLRLTVRGLGGALSQDEQIVYVKHAEIRSPTDGAYLGGGQTVTITGSASCARLVSYTLAYQPAYQPSQWYQIHLGDHSVEQGVLSSWDISEIAVSGAYRLRLSVFGNSYVGHDDIDLVLDQDLRTGWPQQVENRVSNEAIAVADLDGDGKMEIIASEGMYLCGGALEGGRCGRYGMRVYVWGLDGRIKPGWPLMPGSDNQLTAPTLADLDIDGDIEIIVGSIDGAVYAYHHDGSTVNGWPQFATAPLHKAAVCGDLDGDGFLEVAVSDSVGQVHAWHADGSGVTGWPQPIGDSASAGNAPLLVDLDGDGTQEVFATDAAGWAHAWTGEGTTLPGWPQVTATAFTSDPVAGDLERDGGLALIAVGHDRAHAWLPSGPPSGPRWPVDLAVGGRESTPALADLNRDGLLDILFVNALGRVTVLSGDGQANAFFGGIDDLATGASPIVGDVTGDGNLEILVVSDDRHEFVYLLREDGSAVEEWPRLVPLKRSLSILWERRCSPVLADIDGDLKLEVGLGIERQIIFWDTDGPAKTSIPWPTYRHDLFRSGVHHWPPALTFTAFLPAITG